jgi:hypothetical protein
MKLRVSNDPDTQLVELRFGDEFTLDISCQQASDLAVALSENISRAMSGGATGCCAHPVPVEFEVDEVFRLF